MIRHLVKILGIEEKNHFEVNKGLAGKNGAKKSRNLSHLGCRELEYGRNRWMSDSLKHLVHTKSSGMYRGI